MFECKYKLELKDLTESAKYVYKSQRKKKDKVIAVLIPILMVAVVAMLVVDIVNKKSIVWDIVLLVALVVLEIMYIIIPIMLKHSQKKAFKAQNMGELDYILIKIDANICTEQAFKGEEMIGNNIHNLKSLTSYIEDNERIILVFSQMEYVCIRKNALVGDENKLKEHLQKVMAKNLKK